MDVDAMGSSDASVARLSSGRWARRETGLITKKETSESHRNLARRHILGHADATPLPDASEHPRMTAMAALAPTLRGAPLALATPRGTRALSRGAS